MRKIAIIVAAGTGNRMQTEIPKQFFPLAGKLVLMHSIEKFYDLGFDIIVTLSETYCDFWKQSCQQYHFLTPHQVVVGGKERFYSIQNALKYIQNQNVECHWVAVHDAARPNVSKALIERLLRQAQKTGNAIPGVKPTDTLRKINQDKALKREDFWCIQTPQIFEYNTIQRAYQQDFKDTFTDDASVVEALGVKIYLIDGERFNFKITYPEDLIMMESLIEKEAF